jgi:hypothetical protein
MATLKCRFTLSEDVVGADAKQTAVALNAAPAMPSKGGVRRRDLSIAASALACGWSTAAFSFVPPSAGIVLTVSGRVRIGNAGVGSGGPEGQKEAHFDLPMLEALRQHSFITSTPWYPNPRRFTGPLLRDVLAAVGAQGESLRLMALNDYRIDMPVRDTQRYDVIIAHKLDDKPMAVRDKGPLFVIYPFDAHAELRNPVYFGRSAWQLRRIEVL